MFLVKVGADVKQLINQSLVINSTAFETDGGDGPKFVGSKTESALLEFSRSHMGAAPVQEERANANVVQVVPFDSSSKYMATVINLGNGQYRALAKGAPEILLAKSNTVLADPVSGLSIVHLGTMENDSIQNTIRGYASNSLRTLGLVYRDFDEWPPAGAQDDEEPTMAKLDTLIHDMIFIGVVGIKDPLREGVTQAVEDSRQAGVSVRMVTGDNVITAMAIARECGIYTPETGGTVVEGPEFRKMSEQEMDSVIPHLQVLARSSPEDKQILVKRLKALGETVAVTGDGTNDAPALTAADVGFSMVTGTEVAKEASSIVLMDDNFSSIVKAIMWGRAVNDAVKKFLQVSPFRLDFGMISYCRVVSTYG
jgi:Ca2+-transporting ATPase